MTCKIRKWKLSDAKAVALALSNKKYRIIFGTDYLTLTQSKTEWNLFLICSPQMKTRRLRLLLR